MIKEVVEEFVDAKIARADISVALYKLAPDLGGLALLKRVTQRLRKAIARILESAPDTEPDDFPGWSPKRDVIAFTSFRDGDFEIYTIRPDGSDLKRITHDGGNDAHGAWSPDGEWYIFSSSRVGWKDEGMLCDGGDQPYADLFAMHADGSGLRQLTDNQWEDGLPTVQPRPR